MYERNGQPLEKVVRQFVRLYFLRPKKRPYKTNNFYAALARQDQLDREVYRIVQGKKQTPAKDAPGKGRRRLTRAERREIDAAIRRAARTDKRSCPPRTASPINVCGRTACAGSRTPTTPRRCSFRTSITSSVRTRTRRPFSRGGVIS